MRKILPKILIFAFFLVSSFYFLLSAAPAHATFRTTPAQSNTKTTVSNTNPEVPNTLHNWTQNVMIEVMSALTCQLAGIDPINPKQSCLGIDPVTNKIGFLQKTGLPAEASAQAGGAIGFMGNMITMLYTPPLHTADYFQNLAQNFGISKHAFAQQTGTGFEGLRPLLALWTAFRNIVYLFLVIIFVVIGLAIMLRVKIDPRTVMSVQNQIPKIIIGILAVTFSFAIAGFLIDLMWVFIYLIFGIISGISPDIAKSVTNLNPSLLQNTTVLGGAMGVGDINGLATNIAASGSDVLKGMLGIAPTGAALSSFSEIKNPLDFLGWVSSIVNIIGVPLNLNPVSWLMNLASLGVGIGLTFKTLSLPPASAVGFGLGFIQNIPAALPLFTLGYTLTNVALREFLPFLIIYLIIFITLFTALIRLWFTLIMAYVQILIDVVLAPFWIIGGIVPGSPVSLSGWLRDLIANLAAFPATIAMFMLGKVFMDNFQKCPATNPTCAAGNFVPPLVGNSNNLTLIGSVIGLGIILMTPNIVNMLKTALKAPKIDTGGVGKSIGAGAGVLTGTGKSTAGAGSAFVMGDPLTGKTGIQGLRSTLQRKFFGS